MLATCIGEGLLAARRNPGLTILVWCWTLLLAGIAAFPAWIWLGQGFDLRPESDRLLSGFSFSVFAELAQYDRSPVGGILFAVLFGVLGLALLANPLLSGGLIELLAKRGRESPPMGQFWHGAGFYFWRFFRLLIYAAVTAILIFAAAGAALAPFVRWLDERSWEPGFLLGRLLAAGLLSVLGAWILLALDFARARTAIEESRRTFRNWIWSFLFVWRHPVIAFGMLVSAAMLFAVAAGIYAAVRGSLNPSAWAAIALTIVLQQLLMWYRCSLRIGLVAAQLACYRQLFPPAAAPAVGPEAATIEPAPAAGEFGQSEMGQNSNDEH